MESTVTKGKVFYEVTLHSVGDDPQIGWVAPKLFRPTSHGEGVGDNDSSWAVDGQRKVGEMAWQCRLLARLAFTYHLLGPLCNKIRSWCVYVESIAEKFPQQRGEGVPAQVARWGYDWTRRGPGFRAHFRRA